MRYNMVMIRKQKKTLVLIRHYTLVGCLIAVLFVAARWVYNSHLTKQQADSMLQEVTLRQDRLEKRLDAAQERNAYLQTSTGERDFMVERRGMITRGERVLILVEEDVAKTSPVGNEGESNWWQRLWD